MKKILGIIAILAVLVGFLVVQRSRSRPSMMTNALSLSEESQRTPATAPMDPPQYHEPETKQVWGAKDYRVVPSKPGILAVKSGGETLVAFHSELTWHSCQNDLKGVCIRFPGGRDIQVNPQIAKTFAAMHRSPSRNSLQQGRYAAESRKRSVRR